MKFIDDSDNSDDLDELRGSWSLIKDINDSEVTEMADYAVAEYCKQSGAKLELVKVIRDEWQLVAETNNRLVLEVKDGTTTSTYEAIVYDRSWEHFRELTSFKPLQ